MPPDNCAVSVTKPEARASVTNGSTLLAGVDGRSTWARRLRDLIELHTNDLGGEANISEAEKAIVRRASVLICELERMERLCACRRRAQHCHAGRLPARRGQSSAAA
jgi:hypothetical protein